MLTLTDATGRVSRRGVKMTVLVVLPISELLLTTLQHCQRPNAGCMSRQDGAKPLAKRAPRARRRQGERDNNTSGTRSHGPCLSPARPARQNKRGEENRNLRERPLQNVCASKAPH